MSLFYNNYQKLSQENSENIAKLSAGSWNCIKRMTDYIASFHRSLFELEVIKKDLIGMGLEADMQGQELEEKIGVPEKELCDNLIRDGMKPSRTGSVIQALRKLALQFLAMHMFLFVTQGCPLKYGISAWEVVWVFGLNVAGYFTYWLFGKGKMNYYEKRKQNACKIAGTVLYAVLVVIYLLPKPFAEFYLISGNGWVIAAIVLGISAIVFFGSNYYWDKCSGKYNWE